MRVINSMTTPRRNAQGDHGRVQSTAGLNDVDLTLATTASTRRPTPLAIQDSARRHPDRIAADPVPGRLPGLAGSPRAWQYSRPGSRDCKSGPRSGEKRPVINWQSDPLPDFLTDSTGSKPSCAPISVLSGTRDSYLRSEERRVG